MFVAASSRCFAESSLFDACQQITDLEFDKVEIWLDDRSDHLKPSDVAADPERFYTQFREATRLTPIAFCLEHDVDVSVMGALSRLAKMMRIARITIPASPVGTPFNTEIDRLRQLVATTSQDGVRLSVKTKAGDISEDPQTAVELCQAVNGLGLTLDPSYFICGPNRGKPYDQVFPHVFHVHLRDTTPEKVQVQIGLGEVDYSRIVGLLQRQNYMGALSVELIPSMIPADQRALEMRKLRMLLDTLL